MMFHSSRMPTHGGGVALGKFAGYPEFLRASDASGGEAIDTLDSWMDEGIQSAHERWGAEWGTSFLMGAAYGFLWKSRPDDPHLCGIIAPSRDAVGRDYPLVVAGRFAPGLVARAPHIVPLAFGDFLDQAYQLVDEARSTPMPIGDFNARLQALQMVTTDEVLRAEADYAAWSNGTWLEQGWAALFPSERPLDEAAHALDIIGAALAPVRDQRTYDRSLVLRLPLGNGGVGAAALWFDVVRRICRWGPATIPSAFWAVDNQALLLPVGAVPPRAFGELWRPSDTGYVCASPDSAPWSTPPWSFRNRAVVEPGRLLREFTRESSMAGFLDALAR